MGSLHVLTSTQFTHEEVGADSQGYCAVRGRWHQALLLCPGHATAWGFNFHGSQGPVGTESTMWG